MTDVGPSTAPNSGVSVNPFTQDVGKTSDNKTMQKTPLLRIDHEDPTLHYIGEGLPKPGETEATWAGRHTTVGDSPLPARADHSHDTYFEYGVYATSGFPARVLAPPGQTLVSFQHLAGRNMFAIGSNTLLVFPDSGIWFTSLSMTVERFGGGTFQGEINLLFYYLNGTVGRPVYRIRAQDIPTLHYISVQDYCHIHQNQVNVSGTWELAYQHSDVVSHVITINVLTTVRHGEYP